MSNEPVSALLEVISQHSPTFATTDYLKMVCRHPDCHEAAWSNEHVASAISALPGTAVVPVPTEQMTDRSDVSGSLRDLPMWTVGDAWACLAGEEIEFETNSQNVNGIIPADKVLDFVSVLLAALRATGDQK